MNYLKTGKDGLNMKHFNSNKLCIVLTKFTGPDPTFHEMSEIAVIPIGNLVVDDTIVPFNVKINVNKKGKLTEQEYDECRKYGFDTFTSYELFDNWYKKLGLKFNKRIMPISYEWAIHRAYVANWLGYADHVPLYNDYFSHWYRDLMPIGLYWNDLAELNNEYIPFSVVRLKYLGNKLGVPLPRSSTLLDLAYYIAEIYEKITSLVLPTGVDLPLRYPHPAVYRDNSEQWQSESEE